MMQVQQPRPPSQVSAANPSLFLVKSILLIVVLVLSLLLAFPSAFIGGLLWLRTITLRDAREWMRGTTAAAIFGLIVYGLWIWLADPLPGLWNALTFDLAHHLWTAFEHTGALLWAFNLWLAPACGVLYVALTPRREDQRRGSGQPKQMPQADYEREENEQTTQALVQFEGMLATKPLAASLEGVASSSVAAVSPALSSLVVPGAQPSYEALGSYIQGELDSWVFGGELCVPPDWLELHGIVIGEPKFGKTWTLLRLAVIARLYGYRVIYLDMKGSRKTAALFLAAMSMLKVRRMKIYPLEAYDGFRGTPKSLFNRLMEQIDPRTHPFYKGGVGSSLLSLAVNAPVGMPKNSYELLERLNYDWLKAAYSTDAQAMREIEALVPHIDGLQLVMAGFFRGIAGGLDGQWAYEDVDAAYIGIDSIAHKEEAALMGRYLLDDAADFATARKPADERVLLIIDEFGGLRSKNATSLYEKIRESGMAVYASGQSYQTLGDERDSLLAASSIKILHRTGNPKPILEYAGERERYTYTRMVGDAETESDEEMFHPLANQVAHRMVPMMRPQKELAVLVEDVQQLELGQVAVISGGKGGFAQVYPLAIPHHLTETAARFIATAPKFKPLPPPTLPPPAPKPLKKKIAASNNTNKNSNTNNKPKQKAAAAPGQNPTPPPTTVSRKQSLPQNAGKQPAAQSPQQQPVTPQATTPPATANAQPPDDDDVIDFFN